MRKFLYYLYDLFLSLKVGARVKTANAGKSVDQVTIRFRDYYLFVDFDAETGDPTGDFGWSTDPTMNPTMPIRDIWVATPPPQSNTKQEAEE